MAFTILIILVFWLIPLVIIARSKKVSANEKLAWLLATIFVSWLSFILFLLLAPLKPRDSH